MSDPRYPDRKNGQNPYMRPMQPGQLTQNRPGRQMPVPVGPYTPNEPDSNEAVYAARAEAARRQVQSRPQPRQTRPDDLTAPVQQAMDQAAVQARAARQGGYGQPRQGYQADASGYRTQGYPADARGFRPDAVFYQQATGVQQPRQPQPRPAAAPQPHRMPMEGYAQMQQGGYRQPYGQPDPRLQGFGQPQGYDRPQAASTAGQHVYMPNPAISRRGDEALLADPMLAEEAAQPPTGRRRSRMVMRQERENAERLTAGAGVAEENAAAAVVGAGGMTFASVASDVMPGVVGMPEASATPFASDTMPEVPAASFASAASEMPEVGGMPFASTASDTMPEVPAAPFASVATPEVPDVPAAPFASTASEMPEVGGMPFASTASDTMPEVPAKPFASITTPEVPATPIASAASEMPEVGGMPFASAASEMPEVPDVPAASAPPFASTASDTMPEASATPFASAAAPEAPASLRDKAEAAKQQLRSDISAADLPEIPRQPALDPAFADPLAGLNLSAFQQEEDEEPEQEDCMDTSRMPIPAPVSTLDIPKTRRGNRWLALLAVAMLLLAATGFLWLSGAGEKLVDGATELIQRITNPTVETGPMTVTPEAAALPAMLTITLTTGEEAADLRLMDDADRPFKADITRTPAGDGVLWTCQIHFQEPYEGLIRASLLMDGQWKPAKVSRHVQVN